MTDTNQQTYPRIPTADISCSAFTCPISTPGENLPSKTSSLAEAVFCARLAMLSADLAGSLGCPLPDNIVWV